MGDILNQHISVFLFYGQVGKDVICYLLMIDM